MDWKACTGKDYLLVGSSELDRQGRLCVSNNLRDDSYSNSLSSRSSVAHRKFRLNASHIASFNDAIQRGFAQILDQFKIDRTYQNRLPQMEKQKFIMKYSVHTHFSDIKLENPTNSNSQLISYPNECLRNSTTYAANLRATITAKITALDDKNEPIDVIEPEPLKNFALCRIPVMVDSKKCNLQDNMLSALENTDHDPDDPGGYFIVKGIEYVIENVESILFNMPRIFKNVGHNKEACRCEFISKPGDGYANSDQMIIRLLVDGQLTIEIVRGELKGILFPLMMFFRLLGVNTDQEICEMIHRSLNDKLKEKIENIIIACVNCKYATFGRIDEFTEESVKKKLMRDLKNLDSFRYYQPYNSKNNEQNIIHCVQSQGIDTWFLPHMGTGPEFRRVKAQFLGTLVQKLLLVHLGERESTDRDSYTSKRILSAGSSYLRSLKTIFYETIVRKLSGHYQNMLSSTEWKNIKLEAWLKQKIAAFGTNFKRLMASAINTGHNTQLQVGQHNIKNRLSTQILNRKNSLAVIATLRQVSSQSSDNSKQSRRAKEMRMVHMSALGFIGLVSSPTGIKAGINKQLALYTFVSVAGSSEEIHSELIKMDQVSEFQSVAVTGNNLYVNGKWIGIVEDSIDFATELRKKRRKMQFATPMTSIVVEDPSAELHIWCDSGRPLIPVFLVYNNLRDPKFFDKKERFDVCKKFKQKLLFTPKMAADLRANKITIENLYDEQVIEYISPQEQLNCYICADARDLILEEKEITKQYTHCYIPQCMLGVPGLTVPFGNHNMIVRNVYQSNQGKQACGKFINNWAMRCDKGVFGQYVTERPQCQTIVDNDVSSSGSNTLIALMSYSGYNQEDSMILSKGAVDRGLFAGCKFTFYKDKLAGKEEFNNPKQQGAALSYRANYDKLNEKGFVDRGTVLEKGDVVIGKIQRTDKTNFTNQKTTDKSTVYKSRQKGRVYNVIHTKDEEKEHICKTMLTIPHRVLVGDKFSLRQGQKGVCALLMQDSELPRTANGIAPSIIINPHALPTRQTVSQLMEALVSLWCVEKGLSYDATCFEGINIQNLEANIQDPKSRLRRQFEDIGLKHFGYQKLYSGITGEWIDALIFQGMNFAQRLQKFVAEQLYSVCQAPKESTTMQNVRGRQRNGGLRIGEMERDVLCAHGAMAFLGQKFYNHSDRYVWRKCRCGHSAATFNDTVKVYECDRCKDTTEPINIETSWSSKLCEAELKTAGIGMKMKFKNFVFPFRNENKYLKKQLQKRKLKNKKKKEEIVF